MQEIFQYKKSGKTERENNRFKNQTVQKDSKLGRVYAAAANIILHQQI